MPERGRTRCRARSRRDVSPGGQRPRRARGPSPVGRRRHAEHLTRGAHLGLSPALTPGNRQSEPTGALTATRGPSAARPAASPTSASDAPSAHRTAAATTSRPVAFATTGTVRLARIGLDHDDALPGDDHLHVEDAADVEPERDPSGGLGRALLDFSSDALGR